MLFRLLLPNIPIPERAGSKVETTGNHTVHFCFHKSDVILNTHYITHLDWTQGDWSSSLFHRRIDHVFAPYLPTIFKIWRGQHLHSGATNLKPSLWRAITVLKCDCQWGITAEIVSVCFQNRTTSPFVSFLGCCGWWWACLTLFPSLSSLSNPSNGLWFIYLTL